MQFKKRSFVVVALTLPLSLAACDDAPPQAGADAAAEGPAEDDAEIEVDITAHPIEDPLLHPEDYVGESVTVSSDVEAVLGAHAFTIAAPQGPYLVVSPTGMGGDAVIERGAAVQVRGTVRDAFSVSEFEDQFSVDLDERVLADFEERMYLVADSVTEPQQDEGA